MESYKSLTTGNTVCVTETGYAVIRTGSPKPLSTVALQKGDPSVVGCNGAGIEDLLSMVLHAVGVQCDNMVDPTTEDDANQNEHLRAAYASLLTARSHLISASGIEPSVL